MYIPSWLYANTMRNGNVLVWNYGDGVTRSAIETLTADTQINSLWRRKDATFGLPGNLEHLQLKQAENTDVTIYYWMNNKQGDWFFSCAWSI